MLNFNSNFHLTEESNSDKQTSEAKIENRLFDKKLNNKKNKHGNSSNFLSMVNSTKGNKTERNVAKNNALYGVSFNWKNIDTTNGHVGNPNSIFAKFREELTKNKEIVDEEIQKAKLLTIKHGKMLKSHGGRVGNQNKDQKLCISSGKDVNKINKKESKINSPAHSSKNSLYKTDRNFIIEERSKTVDNFKLITSLSGTKTFNTHKTQIINPATINMTPILLNQDRHLSVKFFNYPNNLPSSKKNSVKEIVVNKDKDFLITNIRDKSRHPSTVKNTQKSEIVPIIKKQVESQLNTDDVSSIKNKSNEKVEVKEYSRLKSYKVEPIKNWHEKHGIPMQNFSPFLLDSVEHQSSLVIDEIKVLLDNIQYFKLNFVNSKDMMSLFKNMDPAHQIKFNKTIEESCGLLMEIPSIILLDFSQYLERFVAIQPPQADRLKTKEIKNEESNFIYNCRLISDISLFIKSCFEVYTILVKQVDDMVIPFNNFNKLMQYLARARYNVSNLIMASKNTISNMKNDEKNLMKFKSVFKNDNEVAVNPTPKNNKKVDLKKIKSKLPKITKRDFREYVDLGEKIRRQFIFKVNEENQRIIRLNNVLIKREDHLENSFELKKKELGKKFVKQSALVKILIYIFLYRILI